MFKIKEILKEKCIKQYELAEKLGMTNPQFINTLKRNPTIETLQKIAKALDVEVIDLFEDKRENKGTPIYVKDDKGNFKEIGFFLR